MAQLSQSWTPQYQVVYQAYAPPPLSASPAPVSRPADVRDRVAPRTGMSVQDLKTMTAMRMAHHGGPPPPPSSGPNGPHASPRPEQPVMVAPHPPTIHRPEFSPPPQIIITSGYPTVSNGQQSEVVMAYGSPPTPTPAAAAHPSVSSVRRFSNAQSGSASPPYRLPMEHSASQGRLPQQGLSVEELKELTKLRLQAQGQPPARARAGTDGGIGLSVDTLLKRAQSTTLPTTRGGSMKKQSPSHSLGDSNSGPGSRARYTRALSMPRVESVRMDERISQLTVDPLSPKALSQPASPCFSPPISPGGLPYNTPHTSPNDINGHMMYNGMNQEAEGFVGPPPLLQAPPRGLPPQAGRPFDQRLVHSAHARSHSESQLQFRQEWGSPPVNIPQPQHTYPSRQAQHLRQPSPGMATSSVPSQVPMKHPPPRPAPMAAMPAPTPAPVSGATGVVMGTRRPSHLRINSSDAFNPPNSGQRGGQAGGDQPSTPICTSVAEFALLTPRSPSSKPFPVSCSAAAQQYGGGHMAGGYGGMHSDGQGAVMAGQSGRMEYVEYAPSSGYSDVYHSYGDLDNGGGYINQGQGYHAGPKANFLGW